MGVKTPTSKLRLTKKEKAGVGFVVQEGTGQTSDWLLEQLNFEGGYNYEEEYTYEELQRITTWIWKKLGMEA